jgi:hypothetical protein
MAKQICWQPRHTQSLVAIHATETKDSMHPLRNRLAASLCPKLSVSRTERKLKRKIIVLIIQLHTFTSRPKATLLHESRTASNPWHFLQHLSWCSTMGLNEHASPQNNEKIYTIANNCSNFINVHQIWRVDTGFHPYIYRQILILSGFFPPEWSSCPIKLFKKPYLSKLHPFSIVAVS